MKYLKMALQPVPVRRSFASAIIRKNFVQDIKGLDMVLEQLKVPVEADVEQKGYRYGEGVALRVVKPKTTYQVSQILEYCNNEGIAVIPQGGNSGLVGSSTADKSGKQIVLSTQLLNKDVLDLDGDKLTVGAGWVLDSLNEKLADYGLFLPIDIGSSGSANIGGLIATNAAGSRAARYGNAKARTIETTVVLANGEVYTVETDIGAVDPDLPQDNSRIDVRNPFIGSQGWLGVIVEAKVRLEEKPLKSESVVLVPKDTASIGKIRHEFLNVFRKRLTAFEGMSGEALRLVGKNIPNTKYLFGDYPEPVDYALLAEVSSHDADVDLKEQLLAMYVKLEAEGLVVTGLMEKTELYWHHRHHISEAIKLEGKVIATDVAVRGVDRLGAFRDEMAADLQKDFPDLIIAPFGHDALGAVHFNMVWPKEKELSEALKREIQGRVYDVVVNKYKGTFSAEHGVGPHNAWAYERFTPEEVKLEAEELKRRFDPNGILNPNINYGRGKARERD